MQLHLLLIHYTSFFVSGFVTYALFIIAIALVLIFYYGPRHGQTNILVYIAICSLIGSLSVMGCKGLGIVLKQTFRGHNELSNPVSWGLLFAVLSCIATQMNYLNKALDIFNTSLVTPIYYVMFTTLTIIASAILFKEWEKMQSSKDSIGAICGFLTIVLGVFLLHAFRDVRFTFKDIMLVTSSQPKVSRPMEGTESFLMHDLETGKGDPDSDDNETTVMLPNSSNHHT